MKSRSSFLPPLFSTFASVIAITLAQSASAATGTWNGAFDGTWDTTDFNWSGVSGSPWNNANGPSNTASFSTSSLAAVVSGPVFTNGITFGITGALSGSSINLLGTTPTIAVSSGQTATISSTVAGSAGLIKSDAGLLRLSSATYTGGTTVSGGRLVLENTLTGNSNFTTDAELEFNLTTANQQLIGGTLGGTGKLIKTGANNLILSDWSGNQTVALKGADSLIDVQAGTLSNFFAAGAFGPAVNWAGNEAGLTVASGATFDLVNNSVTVDELNGVGTINKDTWDTALTLTIGVKDGSGTFSGSILNPKNSLAIVKQGTGTQTLSGGNIAYKGGTTVSGGRLVLENTLTGNQSYTTHAELEFKLTTGNQQLQSGTFSGTGKLIKTGEHELILSNWGGAQTIALTGADSVIDVQEGTLGNFNPTGAPPTNWSGNKAGLTVASGAFFQLRNTSVIVDELNGAGTINKGTWDTAVTLTIGVNDGSGNFSGVITQTVGQSMSLVKQGSGIQTVSGANTYTGTTTVSAGTLVINGNQSAANGAVSVTGKLTGSGTVGGATTIDSAGIHNAGNPTIAGGVGSQAFSSTLNYANGSIFEWDLNANSTASGFDTVSAAGNITVGTATVFKVIFGTGVDLNNTFWSTPFTTESWSMTSIFGKAFSSGSFSSVTSTADPITQGSFSISGSTLTWTAVPEPTSALAGLLIGAGLLRRRRTA